MLDRENFQTTKDGRVIPKYETVETQNLTVYFVGDSSLSFVVGPGDVLEEDPAPDILARIRYADGRVKTVYRQNVCATDFYKGKVKRTIDPDTYEPPPAG